MFQIYEISYIETVNFEIEQFWVSQTEFEAVSITGNNWQNRFKRNLIFLNANYNFFATSASFNSKHVYDQNTYPAKIQYWVFSSLN